MGGVAKVASMDKYVLPTMAKGLRYAAVKPLEKVVAPIIIGMHGVKLILLKLQNNCHHSVSGEC
jgi:hypothetical protein